MWKLTSMASPPIACACGSSSICNLPESAPPRALVTSIVRLPFAMDLSLRLQEFDQRFTISWRQLAAVEMAGIAVAALTGVEADAVALGIGSFRHEADLLPVIHVVAAVEGPWTLVREEQGPQARN